MAGAQVTTDILQLQKQRLGYQAISLTNYAANTEPQIAAGSKVEVGGALFEFAALESITGWAGIGINNDVYIKLIALGMTAEFTTTPPTWSTSKQGWYVGLDRYVAKLYKDASGNYTAKKILDGGGATAVRSLSSFILENEFLAGRAFPGDEIMVYADAKADIIAAGYVKVKEILCPTSGSLRISFELKRIGSSGPVYGRVYKNGIAFGTERTTTSATFVEFSEDLAFDPGDLIQLYGQPTTGDQANLQNFRVKTIYAGRPVLNQILRASLVLLDVFGVP